MSGLDLRSSQGLPGEGCVLYSPRFSQEPPAQGSVPTSNRLCPYILLCKSLWKEKMRHRAVELILLGSWEGFRVPGDSKVTTIPCFKAQAPLNSPGSQEHQSRTRSQGWLTCSYPVLPRCLCLGSSQKEGPSSL